MKKMKKPILALSTLVLSLAGLVSCVNNNQPGGTDEPGTDEPGTDEPSGPGQEAEIDEDKTYEEWLSEREWNKPGHLYFHYLRPGASEAEYAKYAVWLWEADPGQEGTLWGASNKTVQKNFNCMSTSWLTNLDGKGATKDETGHILDIDLTRTDLIDGKYGQPVDFSKSKIMGFLIVDQTTMGGGDHWTSDGSKNMYISNFQSHWREDGSMHLFCQQGSVDEYAFTNGVPVTPNPTIKDTTKNYRSTSNVNSSAEITKSTATAPSFKNNGVGYQIFVRSFRDSNNDGKGDINGIRDALREGFFDDLNVDTLWLTPVQKCESYHGYDAMDYYDIDYRFGTMADYEALLNEAHAKGIKVLMDLVLNHSSKNNEWFMKSQKAKKETIDGKEVNWRDVYHWKYAGDEVLGWNVKEQKFEKMTVEKHKDWYKDGESNYYYYGKFGSGMPELNYDCELTRTLVKDMAKYWLAKGVDGFRLDAVKHIYMKDEVDSADSDTVLYDISEKSYYDEEMRENVTEINDYSSDLTKNINFWKDFSGSLKAEYPNCFLVGENFDGYGARIAPFYQALDSQFDFSTYYHVKEWIYQKKNQKNAANYAVEQAHETYDNFAGSGTSSLDGTTDKGGYHPGVTVSQGKRSDFINGAFTSNHDVLRMVNHVNGDNTEVTYTAGSSTINKAKVAAMVTMLTPGISWIYYGDELGMASNTKTHESIYGNKNNEDIWYRQPYKWFDGNNAETVHGTAGKEYQTAYKDGRYNLEWDKYNKLLPSYTSQKKTEGSMYKLFEDLGKAKHAIATGDMNNYCGYTFDSNNAVIHYQLGDFKVYIHTGEGNTNPVQIDLGSETFYVGNASGSTLNAYSAIVTRSSGAPVSQNSFSIVINGDMENRIALQGGTPWDMDPSYTQYYAKKVTLAANDVVSFYNETKKESWATMTVDPGSKPAGAFAQASNGIKCSTAGTYDIYIKMKSGQDNIYFEPAK